MAGRSFSSTYAWPRPHAFAPGLPLLASDVEAVRDHQMRLYAEGHAGTAFSQAFERASWGSTFNLTTSASGFVNVMRFELEERHTQVSCWVRGLKDTAGTATVKFTSTNGADSVAITVTTTEGWFPARSSPVLLDVAFSGGVEEIVVSVDTSDANDLILDTVWGRWVPLTTPLDAPAAPTDTFIPIAEEEVAADEGMSVDLAEAAIDNLENIEARTRPLWTWSALAGVTAGGINMGSIQARYYMLPVPVRVGSLIDTRYDANVYAYGGAYTVRLGHGDTSVLDGHAGPYVTDLTHGAGPDWEKLGSVSLPELRPLAGTDLPFAYLEIDGTVSTSPTGISIWSR